MARPVLHLVQVGESRLYWVGEYPLFLKRHPQGWRSHAAPSRNQAKAWLEAQGLDQQYYPTRREALDMLLWALEQEDSPKPDCLPRVSRKGDGSRVTRQGWRLAPAGYGWDIYNPQGVLEKNCRGSLWRALWLLDLLQPERTPEETWPQHLAYDRNQQAVQDGTDRKIEKEVL